MDLFDTDKRIKLTSANNLSKIPSMNTRMRSRVIVGLGNPGTEYAGTRHNAGRMILEAFRTENQLPDWQYKKTPDALVTRGTVDDVEVTLVEPETYMNLSGASVKHFIKNPDDALRLVVVHDDIDLALGSWKISWDRGDGGHNGLKSINETLRTKKFLRLRIGVLPVTNGVKEKPKGEDAVASFVLGKFQSEETSVLEKATRDMVLVLKELLTLTTDEAMNKWNKK